MRPLTTAAHLLELSNQPDFRVPGVDLDLDTLRHAMARFRHHAALRTRVAAGGDARDLSAFEASLPDFLFESFPCKVTDHARISTLTLGHLNCAGGSPTGLARALDPVTGPSPAVRERLAAALVDAALRDDPCDEATGAHLGMLYLLVTPDEIERAVEQTCRLRDCTPEELPLHALPIPLAARERAARLACGARGIAVPEDESALNALRRSLT